MQSRMERYQTDNKKRFERTKKNTELYEKVYDDIYSDTTYKNMQVIDSAKEININRLKNILDDKYNTRQYRNLGDYSIEDINIDNKTMLNNNQSYDINKVLDDARSKRTFIEVAKEKEKYYDFNMSRKNKYNESYNDLEKEEKELEELINTMTIPKQSYEDNDDLLLDLKGDDNTIITKPVKADFDEVTASDLTRNNIDKTSNSSKLDKTFYTDSNMFTKNDFEDFSTISKELNRKRSPLKVLILIIVLLILVALGYFVVTKYILK